jgi:hypothetical protein
MLNIYGPYYDKKVLWDQTLNLLLFKSDKVIFGGDLKFTLGDYQIWGTTISLDPLVEVLIQNMEDAVRIDIQPP